MENFEFYSPTYFAFGKDTENDCGKFVRRYGGTKVLIHYGSESAKKSGLLDRLEASLKSENIDYIMLGGVKPNPRSGLIYEGIQLCKKESVDFILAVGGGSVIDSSKAIAGGSLYDGDFWDFFERKAVPMTALPIGVILTISAAGSEGSAGMVITKEEGMLKRPAGGPGLYPKFTIMNPALTETLPAYQTASGATDIMAHVLERYFTNTKNVELTDRLCEAVLKTLVKETPIVIENPHDYDARANIMWAGMIAHNNTVGVGRSQDWNSHNIEHELSALYDCAHGAGLAVVMPAWMQYVVDHNVMRMAQIAVRLWGCEMDYEAPRNTALAGIAAFKRFLTAIGMPISFAEIGAKEEDIPLLIEKLGLGDNKTGGYVELDKNAIEAILKLAL